MQTLDNGIEVFTNSDDYDLAEDAANLGRTANVVTRVADQAGRDALLKYHGRPIYRLDTSEMEIWNSVRWARPAYTEIGEDYTQPMTIATTSYVTVATVVCQSLGGDLKLEYSGLVENANSGANRTADVQWLVDGNPFGGITYNAPLVAGFPNPATSVSMKRNYPAAAGEHTIELQTRASAAGSVRNVIMSLTVGEKP